MSETFGASFPQIGQVPTPTPSIPAAMQAWEPVAWGMFYPVSWQAFWHRIMTFGLPHAQGFICTVLLLIY